MAILNLGNSNSAFSGSFSGSFQGDGSGLTNILNAQTASYVENAQTASYVLNAVSSSYALTASYVTTAQTASYVENAQTSSFVTLAQTASFVATAQTASYIEASNIDGTITSASYALSASYAVSASFEIIKEVSSSYADTASYVENAQTASYVTLAQTASFVTTAQTASYVLNAQTASYVTTAQTASYVLNAQTASFVTLAQTASYVETAQTASYVLNANNATDLVVQVKNTQTSTILKGQVLHSVGVTGENINVITASNDSATSMPGFAVANQDISSNAAGQAIISGKIKNIDTSGLTAGSNVYVNLNGGYTGTKPSGSSLIQNIGVVGKVNATEGELIILGAGRSNDVPNISPGYIWIGNSDSVATPTATSSIQNVVSSSYASTASYVETAQTASYVTLAQTASYVTTAQTASYVLNAVSSSYALTASYAVSASHEIIKEISSSYADTASYVETSQTASYILASNIDQPFTDITASGNISASGDIIGNSITSSTAQIGNLTIQTGFPGGNTMFGTTNNVGFTFNNDIVSQPEGKNLGTSARAWNNLYQGANTSDYLVDVANGVRFDFVPSVVSYYLWDGSPTRDDTTAENKPPIYSINPGQEQPTSYRGYFGIIQPSGSVDTLSTNTANKFGLFVIGQGGRTILGRKDYNRTNDSIPVDKMFTIYDGQTSTRELFSIETGSGATRISGSTTITGNLTASGNISASGIINGLSGSFKSLDVFVNLPVTTGSKFRVGRMDSQFIGFGVSDYDNIILAKQDTDSNLSHNFILDRDFEGTGANNFKIQKNGIDQFVIDTSGNITASGNISASGDVITKKVGIIDGAGFGLGFEGGGNENSDVQIFTDANGEINFIKDSTIVLGINSNNQVRIRNSYDLYVDQNISASGYISASSFNATPGTINELTASHAMNVQPENNFMPVTTHTTNFTSTSSYAGHYNIVGGNLSVTVTTGSTPTDLTPGMEWNFFQTSSGNNFTFTAGTGINLVSRNAHTKLAAVGSAGTLKYISDQTFHLIGDLTL